MPLINKLILFCPLLVFILGLASCSPDQPEKDTLSIQEPEIVTEKIPSTKVSHLDANFIWSMQDRLRFQDTGGLKLAVKSTCVSAQTQETFEGSQVRSLPKELYIGEILPVSLLTRKNPTEQTQFHCSFEFMAINKKGSQHKFKIPARLLEEQPSTNRNTDIRVNGSPAEIKTGEWLTMDSTNLEKFWVMSPRADRFQLSCSDLQVSGKPSADLVAIDDLLKSTEAQKIQLSVQRAPTQLCRVLAYQNGTLHGWSSYFKINWPSSKLDIQETRHLSQEYWPQTVYGTTHKLYEVRIKNSYTFPIYFSIPDQKDIWMLSMYSENHGYKLKQPFSIVYDKSAAGIILNEKKPFRIGLNPGAQITFNLIVQFTRGCPGWKEHGYAYAFHSLSALSIQRFLNMTDNVEVGSQYLVLPKVIGIRNGHTSGFTPSFPDSYNPPGC